MTISSVLPVMAALKLPLAEKIKRSASVDVDLTLVLTSFDAETRAVCAFCARRLNYLRGICRGCVEGAFDVRRDHLDLAGRVSGGGGERALGRACAAEEGGGGVGAYRRQRLFDVVVSDLT